MTQSNLPVPDKAAALRRAFDRSFAEAPHTETAQLEDFLAIRLGLDPHVIRLVEIASLLPLRRVTPLPSAVPELLGITGSGDAIVPVYDLRALLGYPTGDPPRWMVIAAAMPVALAFDAFDGHLRHPREIRVDPAGAEPSRQQEVLRTQGLVRPVVPVASILANIKSRATQPSVPQKER